MHLGPGNWFELATPVHDQVIAWLLEGDPAIQYQTRRDLLQAPAAELEQTRARIALEGWGAQLLSQRSPADRMWSGHLYSPKWTSTHYSLLLLKDLEIQPLPEIADSCLLLLEKGLWQDGGINFWRSIKHSEVCVTGMLLSMLAFFGVQDDRCDQLADFLLRTQMPDGGWNCNIFQGATHSSLHSTLSVIEGLQEYQHRFQQRVDEIMLAHQRALNFVSAHRLYRSHRTGEIIDPQMINFTFPAYWRYDILRMLDHLQKWNQPPVEAMQDAINILTGKMTETGQWKLARRYSGKIYFPIETVGQPSRWITLKTIRVLNWWNKFC